MNKNTNPIIFDNERYYEELKSSVEAAKLNRHNAIAKGLIKPKEEAKKVEFGLITNNTPMNPHKNLIVNFSRPTVDKIKNSYQLFTNVYFSKYDILEIDSNSLIERSRNILGYQTTFLIIVYPEYGETKSDFIFSNSIPNCQIQVIHISFLGLFEKGEENFSLFDKIYLKNNNSSLALRTLFNFRGWTYAQLVAFFRNWNIILSGGAKSRNHILNPSSHRFSQFISILEGFNMKGVIESFNLPSDLYETRGIEKAILGPKLVKDKHTIGNISTKEYDNKLRALMRQGFNSEVPNARNITNQNNSNQTTISENNNVSNISINVPSKKEDTQYDFRNDPWIDNSLITRFMSEEEAKEYKSRVEKEKNKIIDNLRVSILDAKKENKISNSSTIEDTKVLKSLEKSSINSNDNSNDKSKNSKDLISLPKTKISVSNLPLSKVVFKNIKKFNKIKERLAPKSKASKGLNTKLNRAPNYKKWIVDGKKIILPTYLRPQPSSEISLAEREAEQAERFAKDDLTFKEIREINEARDIAKALKMEQDKNERRERKELIKEIKTSKTLASSARKNKGNFRKPGGKRSYSTTDNLNSTDPLILLNNKTFLEENGEIILTEQIENVNKEKETNLFTFLDLIKEVLEDEKLTTLEKQEFIETKWIENIKQKMLDPEFSKTRLVSNINQAFYNFKIMMNDKRSNKVNLIQSDFLKYFICIESLILAFGYIITYYNRSSYTKIASLIGNSIFWEIYTQFLNDKSVKITDSGIVKKDYKNKYEKFLLDLDLTNELSVKIGDMLIELFIQLGIIDREFNLDDNGKAEIKIKQDYINEIVGKTFVIPTSLPMCHLPNKWAHRRFGGFISNNYSAGKAKDLIQGSFLRENHKIENKKYLFDAINNLNEVQFIINKDFLNYIKKEGQFLLENDDEKNKPQNIISIKIAETFLNTPFYINTYADWRGRIYTHSFFLSYQGSDLAKTLLNFSKGETLTSEGVEYLYLYGANAYNENRTLSKKSINERINWVKINYNKILKMEKEFMLKADAKYIFAAFCLIIKNLHINSDEIVNFPIFLDATCSGIQHLSALMRDEESASRVNLIEQNENDNVRDIYGDIVIPVNGAINNFGNNSNLSENNDRFKKVFLTRKEIKSLVMTKPYNASVFGMAQQLVNTLPKINKNDDNKNNYDPYIYKVPSKTGGYVLLSRADLFKIASIVDKQVFIMYPALKNIYDFLLSISKVLVQLQIPITWFTPLGIKITQSYLKDEIKSASIRTGGKRKTIVLRNKAVDQETKIHIVNKRKQVEAIIPNVIHSLDASLLILVILESKIKTDYPVITVHDCFGTLPNNMRNLETIVRKQFITLYTKDNFIEKFYNKQIEAIEDNHYPVFRKKDLKDNILKKLDIYFETFEIEDRKTQLENMYKLIKDALKITNCVVLKIDLTNSPILMDDSPFWNAKAIFKAIKILNIPDIPSLGKLNFENILNSKYIIT